MARRKSKTRTIYRTAKKSYRRISRPSLSAKDVLLAGAVYGAARPIIADKLPTMFNFGSIDSDNVILAGAGYYLAKKGGKFTKALGLIAMGTEAGIVSNSLIQSKMSISSKADSAAYEY